MKIMDKIELYRDAMIANPDGSIAERIQNQSVAAIMKGIGSAEWTAFMENFHSNSGQLQRLVGDDADFMNQPYGETVLAYLVGGGPCGGGTRLSLAVNMPEDMKDALDDIDSNTVPGESAPLPEEIEEVTPE